MLFFFCFHYSFIHDVICASHTSHAHLTHISCTSHHILYASYTLLIHISCNLNAFLQTRQEMHSLISLDIFAIQKSYSRLLLCISLSCSDPFCALSKQKTAKTTSHSWAGTSITSDQTSLSVSASIECKMGM